MLPPRLERSHDVRFVRPSQGCLWLGTRQVKRGNATLAGVLFLVFLSTGFIGVVNHEMWRDELEAWATARESSSIANLFENLRYAGHPGLWYLFLYLLTRFTRNPVAMQLLHLAFAGTVVYLFGRFSPFTKGQKIVFSFGYFPFYEYALISRDYVLGVLLLFTFCALFRTRTKGYLLLSTILLLLANTTVYGTIIAISLGLTLLFECVVDTGMRRSMSARRWDVFFSLLVFVLGLVSAIFQLMQPSDSGFHVTWDAGLRAGWVVATLTAVWKSYIPMPNLFNYQFWNTNLLMDGPMQVPAVVCAALSLVLLAFSLTLLARKPVALFLYLSGTFGILLFSHVFPYIRFWGSLRHHGHLFMVFVASLWIAGHYGESELTSRRLKGLTGLASRYGSRCVTALLAVHLAAGIVALGFDVLHPFSASKEAAKFIQTQQMADMLIVGTEDHIVSPLAALLDRRIYYLESDGIGTFIVQDNKRKKVSPYQILGKVNQLITQREMDILLVVSYNLAPLFATSRGASPDRDLNLSISGLSAHTRTIVPDEQYFLYVVQRKNDEGLKRE